MKIGLFYGSSTCYTEMAAEKIRDIIGPDIVDIFNVKETPITKMSEYDLLILGISTWDFGELQEDWGAIWDQISGVSLSGKVVALFGLGDQEGYGEWYLDAWACYTTSLNQPALNLLATGITKATSLKRQKHSPKMAVSLSVSLWMKTLNTSSVTSALQAGLSRSLLSISKRFDADKEKIPKQTAPIKARF